MAPIWRANCMTRLTLARTRELIDFSACAANGCPGGLKIEDLTGDAQKYVRERERLNRQRDFNVDRQ